MRALSSFPIYFRLQLLYYSNKSIVMVNTNKSTVPRPSAKATVTIHNQWNKATCHRRCYTISDSPTCHWFQYVSLLLPIINVWHTASTPAVKEWLYLHEDSRCVTPLHILFHKLVESSMTRKLPKFSKVNCIKAGHLPFNLKGTVRCS